MRESGGLKTTGRKEKKKHAQQPLTSGHLSVIKSSMSSVTSPCTIISSSPETLALAAKLHGAKKKGVCVTGQHKRRDATLCGRRSHTHRPASALAHFFKLRPAKSEEGVRVWGVRWLWRALARIRSVGKHWRRRQALAGIGDSPPTPPQPRPAVLNNRPYRKCRARQW